MSNTYFKLDKAVVTKDFNEHSSYTTQMELSLTAFMGNENVVQLTVQTSSTIPNHSDCAYIQLSEKDIDKLIFALLERKHRLISATGSEQSLVKS